MSHHTFFLSSGQRETLVLNRKIMSTINMEQHDSYHLRIQKFSSTPPLGNCPMQVQNEMD